MGMLVGYLLIFFARVLDVTLGTVRMLMVVQGRKIQAGIIGFFEMVIYVVALNEVVGNLDNIGNLLAYALGFAFGNYAGVYIENKIGLGNFGTQIILKTDDNTELVNDLRENGFGVTILNGKGREGNRQILNVVIKRKNLERLKEIVYDHDSRAFITVNSISPISGGYFSPIKRK